MFVCLGLTSLLNICGHITTVPTCSSSTFTNVLPHRNAMQQTQDMTPHPSQNSDTCGVPIHYTIHSATAASYCAIQCIYNKLH